MEYEYNPTSPGTPDEPALSSLYSENDTFIDEQALYNDEDEFVLETEVSEALNKMVSVQKVPKDPQPDSKNAAMEQHIHGLLMLTTPGGKVDFPVILDSEPVDEEYTFENMFGIEATDPFIVNPGIEGVSGPDVTKKSIVTRMVQGYFEPQKKMRVPSLPVDPVIYKFKSSDRLVYEQRNNEYWESILSQLALDSEEHLAFIMKPDFCDVLPQMLNKYKHGLMPTIDSTWTVAPRLDPRQIFADMKKSADYGHYFPDFVIDRERGVTTFTHPDFKQSFKYKTNNDSALESNAFRRMLLLVNKRSLGGKLDDTIRNLKHCKVATIQSRNLPRLLCEDDHFQFYTSDMVKYFAEIDREKLPELFVKLFQEMLRAKQFRYNYEERNKELLYYTDRARSTFYRYEYFLPDAADNEIAIFSPDKRLTHYSLMPLLTKNCKVTLYSDLAYEEHDSTPRIYRRTVNVRRTNDFFFMLKTDPNRFQTIYLDFVEVKVLGRMLFGTYCQSNIIACEIQRSDFQGRLVARLGISPEYPIVPGNIVQAISIFKAGGLEYIAQIRKSQHDCDMWNNTIMSKLLAVKTYVEHIRKVTVMAGFGLTCHDYRRPISNEIRWTVPETAFSVSGQTMKPFAYQHTRQTNKFTVRSEDFLDNWVNLSKREQDPQDRIYTSALLKSNLDIHAAHSLLDHMNVPSSIIQLKTILNQMVRMSELPPDLLTAIRISIMLPKKKSHLLKKCPQLDDYIGLFEVVSDGADPMLRFQGACEMTSEMRTVFDLNNMRQRV